MNDRGQGNEKTEKVAETWDDSWGAGLEHSDRVGRFVLLEPLGSGGMGVVYTAYDPKLDRKIALKFLRGHGPRTSARLVREAQALAQLTHPNVVSVHDVGTIEQRVWLAMEYVDGQTLAAWLAAQPERGRSWERIVELLLGAAQGIIAAHAVGLVHRDIKPSNLMLGRDGRVRVMDFGLVTAGEPKPGSGEATLVFDDPNLDPSRSLTRTGAMLGTPAYMAPEQFRGLEVDTRADQFSFCVVLWEALFGERPFVGESVNELRHAVLHDRRRPIPRAKVPRWLRQVVSRGLAPAPAQRWDSMQELVRALSSGQRRRSVRRIAAGLGLAFAIGGAAELQGRWDRARVVASCEAEAGAIDEVWNAASRARVEASLGTLDFERAETFRASVLESLDAHAEAWRRLRSEVCLRTKVEESWEADTLARARWCLDTARLDLASLSEELSEPDAVALDRAVGAIARLESPERCGDRKRLALTPMPPPDLQAQVRPVRAQLSRAATQGFFGRYSEALAQSQAALEQAELLDWPPLLARARYQTGRFMGHRGDYDGSIPLLEQAYFEAAAIGAPDVAAEVALWLVGVYERWLTDLDAAEHWGQLAEVELRRMGVEKDSLAYASLLEVQSDVLRGRREYPRAVERLERAMAITRTHLGPDAFAFVELQQSLAMLWMEAGKFDRARPLLETTYAAKIELLGPSHPALGNAYNFLAIIEGSLGNYEQARDYCNRALPIYERSYGPAHPKTAHLLRNLANLQLFAGEYREARVLYRRTLEIWLETDADSPEVASALRQIAGTDHYLGDYPGAIEGYRRAIEMLDRIGRSEGRRMAMTLTDLGDTLSYVGDYEGAREPLERAQALFATLAPGSESHGNSLAWLGRVASSTGDPAGAASYFEQALRFYEAQVGFERVFPIEIMQAMAESERRAGQLEAAHARYTEILATIEASWEGEHPSLVRALTGLAQVELDRGQAELALPLATRAVELGRDTEGYVRELAEARLTLALILCALEPEGCERGRARKLMTAARAGFVALGGPGEALELTEAWLALPTSG